MQNNEQYPESEDFWGFGDVTHLITPADPLYHSWNDNHYAGVERVLRKYNIQWASMNVIRLGRYVDVLKNQPVIRIVIRNSLHNDDLERQVKDEISHHLFLSMESLFQTSLHGESLQVSFIHGNVERYETKIFTHNPMDGLPSDVRNTVEDFGSSNGGRLFIGQTIQAGAGGTMGMMINLKQHESDGGGDELYGLTASHVARPLPTSEGEIPVHLFTDKQLKESVERSKSNYQEALDTLDSNPHLSAIHVDVIIDHMRKSNMATNVVEELLQHPRRLWGTVGPSSGVDRRTSYGGTLDWALIKPKQVPKEYNKLSSGAIVGGIDVDFFSKRSKHPATQDTKTWEELVDFFGGIKGNNFTGRGYVNGIRANVCMDKDSGVSTKEWAIIRCNRRDEYQEAIPIRGDSGNVAFTRREFAEFRACGLVIGGDDPLSHSFCYVLPLQEVMRDIESVTGRRVSFPISQPIARPHHVTEQSTATGAATST